MFREELPLYHELEFEVLGVEHAQEPELEELVEDLYVLDCVMGEQEGYKVVIFSNQSNHNLTCAGE